MCRKAKICQAFNFFNCFSHGASNASLKSCQYRHAVALIASFPLYTLLEAHNTNWYSNCSCIDFAQFRMILYKVLPVVTSSVIFIYNFAMQRTPGENYNVLIAIAFTQSVTVWNYPLTSRHCFNYVSKQTTTKKVMWLGSQVIDLFEFITNTCAKLLHASLWEQYISSSVPNFYMIGLVI